MQRTLAAETGSKEGQEVLVKGWVHSRRDHGNLIFIDLRDHTGLIQVTVNKDLSGPEVLSVAEKIRDEWVLAITGTIENRAAELINPNLETGKVEIKAKSIEVLTQAKTPPFPVARDEDLANEDIRLKYRFIDLRRPKIQKYLKQRAQVIKHIRNFMDQRGFWEITTPILANSSPEGARDFLVPSRLHPGKFYALPQAPQQFKQLLMVGGIPRYYQIAACFRDEDARADRSPGEFYQLDMEMSFATQEEVWKEMEDLFKEVTEKFSTKKIQQFPFPKIKYADAMDMYGTDKPDLRFEMKLQNVTELVRDCGFSVFSQAILDGGIVKAIVAPNASSFSRSQIDQLTAIAKEEGAKGLAYIVLEGKEVKSPITKFLGEELTQKIIKEVGAQSGDIIFFAADKADTANKTLGKVRSELGSILNLKDPNIMAWCWVYDFPMYSWNKWLDKLDFEHNPFSMPYGGIETLETKDPYEIIAQQYDLVGNGLELSSGAVRNHQPETMYKAFELAGYTRAEVDIKFGHMIEAFSYGAPPHAGNAPGIDRILMVLWDEPNIREVIAFPKNGRAEDPMLGAPSEVTEQQLKDVHIKLDVQKKK